MRTSSATFAPPFGTVFAAANVTIIRTPFRSLQANAFAARWIRSVREDCLDHLLIINERHLERMLTEYGAYYHQARPHQGIEQQCPVMHELGPNTDQYGGGRCWVGSSTTTIGKPLSAVDRTGCSFRTIHICCWLR